MLAPNVIIVAVVAIEVVLVVSLSLKKKISLLDLVVAIVDEQIIVLKILKCKLRCKIWLKHTRIHVKAV